jgi:hypothetical protein
MGLASLRDKGRIETDEVDAVMKVEKEATAFLNFTPKDGVIRTRSEPSTAQLAEHLIPKLESCDSDAGKAAVPHLRTYVAECKKNKPKQG